jgi:hypothetical protein
VLIGHVFNRPFPRRLEPAFPIIREGGDIRAEAAQPGSLVAIKRGVMNPSEAVWIRGFHFHHPAFPQADLREYVLGQPDQFDFQSESPAQHGVEKSGTDAVELSRGRNCRHPALPKIVAFQRMRGIALEEALPHGGKKDTGAFAFAPRGFQNRFQAVAKAAQNAANFFVPGGVTRLSRCEDGQIQ